MAQELQEMMRQMQQLQPKFQQQLPPDSYKTHERGRGNRGGRYGRRGRGRGRFQRQNQAYHLPQLKRKRGTSHDMHEATSLFMPSFLEDPWKALESSTACDHERDQKWVKDKRNEREGEEMMRPVQVQQQYAGYDGPGRVLFQPSLLENPWAHLLMCESVL